MILGGLQKTTLIDFPGRLACTVFTVGCNFRCPFCHNRDLVTGKAPRLDLKEFFAFLKKRQKILDGVCITGGEPCLQEDIEDFCRRIKKFGLKVKLDTNGSFPKKLKSLINSKLIDYVAMDIKTTFEDYAKAINAKCRISNIKSSIKLILKSGLEYQFRTTLVPGIHDKKVIKKMAKQLKVLGVRSLSLQNFRPKNCLDPEFEKKEPFSEEEFKELIDLTERVLLHSG